MPILEAGSRSMEIWKVVGAVVEAEVDAAGTAEAEAGVVVSFAL